MQFAHPEAFWLVLLLPILLGWPLWSRRRGAARFSALASMAALPSGWAVWGPMLLILLRTAGVGCAILALARPQTPHANVHSHSDGIAIQLVIDNSYSMRLRDYDLGSQSISRLDAVKYAVRLFVAGGEFQLQGRPNDKIGIITFARDPEVICPATLDHDALLDALDRIQLSPPIGTNIGDALAWALERLRQDPTKQKVIILLSDGSHNVKDSLPPLEGAQLAADLKVKVYTIGAVGNRYQASQATANFFHELLGSARTGDAVDESMMQKIAERTKGRYFRATDVNGLLDIYQEIDRLEKTQMEKTVYVSYREWYFVPLFAGVALLLLEHLLAATRFLQTF